MNHRLLTSAIVGTLLPLGAAGVFQSFRPKESQISIPRGFNSEAYGLLASKTPDSSMMRIIASPADLPEGMCEIVLEAHDVFSNGVSGYQLLLDADHNTFQDLFWGAGMSYFGDYSSFEYSLPEDAEPVKGTDRCLVDGELSAVIPAGVYDWMVILPEPESLWIPSGDFAAVDDFELLAGKSYRMTVDYRQTVAGPSDYVSAVFESDLAITGLSIPASGIGLSAAEPITVNVKNCGTVRQEGFSVKYYINGVLQSTESVSQTLLAGESVDYTFDKKADLSIPGTYNISATVSADSDMYAGNNSEESSCRHLIAVDIPYDCDFSILGTDFEREWIVIDGNNDHSTWAFSEWIANKNGDMGVIACAGCWEGDRTGDDWLISQPLNLKAGKANIAFDHRSVTDTNAETLEICLGTSPSPESMTVVGTSQVCSLSWLDRGMTFNVPCDGVYYIAFHGISNNGYNQFIGNISVKEGEYIGKPAIEILGQKIPFSNCDLPSEAYLGLEIINRGTAALTGHTLTATVNGISKSRTFTDSIEVDEEAILLLDSPFDFSSTGTYEVNLTLSGKDVEESVSAVVTCMPPYTSLPVTTNFTNNENTGFWLQMKPGSWNYEAAFSDFSATAHGFEKGLLSRGFSLDHPVRIKMSYVASGWDSSALGIYFGKAGADISTYTRIFSDPIVNNEAKEVEFTAPVDASGNYSIIIADEGETSSRSFIRLNEVFLSEVQPHDLSIGSVSAPVSCFMPLSQVSGAGTAKVTVCNRGLETMDNVRVMAIIDGQAAGESDPVAAIAPGDTATVYVDFNFPEKKIGDDFSLSFEVVASEPDQYSDDNTYTFPVITVSDTERATEDLAVPEYGTGVHGSTLSIGNVYAFHTAVDLTSVYVGLCFCEDESAAAISPLQLAIWKINDDDSLGRCIYTETFTRGSGGLTELDIQDMRLSPGSYYFEITQLSGQNMGLAYDPYQKGGCWQRNGDTLSYVDGYSLCIRANFDKDALVSPVDACVRSIISPSETSALFSADETVKAILRNAGYESCTSKIILSIDGVDIASQQFDLLPYEDAEVTFSSIDLSAEGTHTIVCTAVLDGDTNDMNDAATLEIISEKELDRYSFDFEGCPDFAANGDRLNPGWTTFDRNGVGTTYFWRYEHPRRGEPCGFMAFNILATNPSFATMPTQGFYPYDGERFGVAYCYDQFAPGAEGLTQSDVWFMSPLLELGDNSIFELYVKTFALEHMQATLEPYRILVSDTDDNPDSFKVVGDDIRRAAVDEWENVSVDLSDYDNKSVYVAVQYIGKPIENTCLMIDNLIVRTSSSGVSSVSSDNKISLSYDNSSAMLYVEGNHDFALDIYTTDGKWILSSPDSSVNLQSLPRGVYLARCGDSVLKFAR